MVLLYLEGGSPHHIYLLLIRTLNAGHSRTKHLPVDDGAVRCLSAMEDLGLYGIKEASLICLLLT